MVQKILIGNTIKYLNLRHDCGIINISLLKRLPILQSIINKVHIMHDIPRCMFIPKSRPRWFRRVLVYYLEIPVEGVANVHDLYTSNTIQPKGRNNKNNNIIIIIIIIYRNKKLKIIEKKIDLRPTSEAAVCRAIEYAYTFNKNNCS